MNKRDQQRIARELLHALRSEFLSRVARVPKEWNGHELRHLLADVAREQFAHRKLDRTRRIDYENTRLARNL